MRVPSFDALKARKKSGLSQTEFWSPIGVKQSTASRYEKGDRGIPVHVQALLVIRYGTAKQHDNMINEICR